MTRSGLWSVAMARTQRLQELALAGAGGAADEGVRAVGRGGRATIEDRRRGPMTARRLLAGRLGLSFAGRSERTELLSAHLLEHRPGVGREAQAGPGQVEVGDGRREVDHAAGSRRWRPRCRRAGGRRPPPPPPTRSQSAATVATSAWLSRSTEAPPPELDGEVRVAAGGHGRGGTRDPDAVDDRPPGRPRAAGRGSNAGRRVLLDEHEHGRSGQSITLARRSAPRSTDQRLDEPRGLRRPPPVLGAKGRVRLDPV